MAKFCTNCGKEIAEGNTVCASCGAPVEGVVAAAQPTVVVNNNATQAKPTNGLAIAGFITSLVSGILCCGSISVISLILSIVGAVKANDLGGSGKGMAIAGIVISAVGIFLIAIVYALGGYASVQQQIQNPPIPTMFGV